MEATEIRQKILEIIDKKHKSSNGHCGVSPVALKFGIEAGYKSIAEQLNYLHENNMILVRNGINGYLLFKKKNPS
ncbi:hypothetical protein [Flagellimonas nanhaiensis]|uniref:Uncharacterized protein n=1 Tax=Flagellimonas nanhaiensis TaxID=2292706 RepID=A0A371JKX1_9FLAO|nr:hypothetical protein [Allomuricauda nanhaiensis]RDY57569.1 hypothetical protein DX873_18600 [Allomuricauda nanhaiensis]